MFILQGTIFSVIFFNWVYLLGWLLIFLLTIPFSILIVGYIRKNFANDQSEKWAINRISQVILGILFGFLAALLSSMILLILVFSIASVIGVFD